jgi:hypothetical protein
LLVICSSTLALRAQNFRYDARLSPSSQKSTQVLSTRIPQGSPAGDSGIQYATNYEGDTIDVSILAAQAALGPGGGIVDATGYGCVSLRIAHQIALGTATQPVILRLLPCQSLLNAVTGGVAPFVMGNGSGVVGLGASSVNRSAGPGATIYNTAKSKISYDFVPANPGSQETYILQGITIASDPAASISGGLILINGIYVNSFLRDVYTFNCYAPSALVVIAPPASGTSDVVFDNDNFDCGGHSTGPVVNIFAPTGTGVGTLTWLGGGIQHAGAGESLLVINGNSQGPDSGTGLESLFFYNVQFETRAEGNACTIQLIDAQHISMNGLNLTGPKPKGKSTAVCITETAAGRSHDIAIDQVATSQIYTQLFSATPFGSAAILTGVGAPKYSLYVYKGTASYVNSNVTFNNSDIYVNNLLRSAAAPTISSGFGGSASVVNPNGTATFSVKVGNGGSASTGVIGMPMAANGWNCVVNDITAAAENKAYNTRQTASSTTTVTVQNQSMSTGAAVAWPAGDVLNFHCSGF